MAKPQDLLDALGGLEPPSPPACFVLLWTYFSARKIGEVESELHGKGIADGQLPNFISSDSPGRKEPREAIEGLRRLAAHASTSGPFDRAALEWLILLDQELGARGVGKWRNVEMQGLDGKCWRLFDRNNWLGRELLGEEERLTGPGVQGRSLFPYARKLIAVRHVPDQGYEINARSLAPRASVTQTRLRQACGHGRLRILCWPFRPRLHHPELSDLRNLPKVARLYSLANEEEAIEDARAAVSRASESETTILLLPELSATAAVESAVKDELRRLQPCGAPALTLLGLCHRPHERDDAGSMKDVNEAVLLDAAGRELHRHRKLTCFQLWRQGCTEGTLLGSTISILETPIGNLVPLICLDLFQDTVLDVVKKCHGSLFLVPSLSPKTSAHHDAARKLAQSCYGATFVANRRLDKGLDASKATAGRGGEDALAAGTSFFHLPRAGQATMTHFGDQHSSPYLLFDLSDFLRID